MTAAATADNTSRADLVADINQAIADVTAGGFIFAGVDVDGRLRLVLQPSHIFDRVSIVLPGSVPLASNGAVALGLADASGAGDPALDEFTLFSAGDIKLARLLPFGAGSSNPLTSEAVVQVSVDGTPIGDLVIPDAQSEDFFPSALSSALEPLRVQLAGFGLFVDVAWDALRFFGATAETEIVLTTLPGSPAATELALDAGANTLRLFPQPRLGIFTGDTPLPADGRLTEDARFTFFLSDTAASSSYEIVVRCRPDRRQYEPGGPRRRHQRRHRRGQHTPHRRSRRRPHVGWTPRADHEILRHNRRKLGRAGRFPPRRY